MHQIIDPDSSWAQKFQVIEIGFCSGEAGEELLSPNIASDFQPCLDLDYKFNIFLIKAGKLTWNAKLNNVSKFFFLGGGLILNITSDTYLIRLQCELQTQQFLQQMGKTDLDFLIEQYRKFGPLAIEISTWR